MIFILRAYGRNAEWVVDAHARTFEELSNVRMAHNAKIRHLVCIMPDTFVYDPFRHNTNDIIVQCTHSFKLSNHIMYHLDMGNSDESNHRKMYITQALDNWLISYQYSVPVISHYLHELGID